jgi:hypothetical protein
VAEVVLLTTAELVRLVHASATAPVGSMEAGMARRIAAGRIRFDRDSLLTTAVADIPPILAQVSVTEAERYAAWFEANYALRMLTPMVAADDAAHRFAIGYRLHAQVGDLCVQYFTIRGLPWRGEKAAYRHWQLHDPAFLTLLEGFFAERAVRRKAEQYRELVRRVIAPIGDIWDEIAAVADAGTAPAGVVLDLWDNLLAASAEIAWKARDRSSAPDGAT